MVPKESLSNHPNRTILIVVDDNEISLILKTVLKEANIANLHLGSGLNAVELEKGHLEVRLVLMGIMMLEMNGFEATRLIKECGQIFRS